MERMKDMMNKQDIIGDVRGKGLLLGIELIRNKEKERALDEAENVM